MSMPDCCTPSEGATRSERAYCAYNAGGDPATAGIAHTGKPCPLFGVLPENVRAKWAAVDAFYAAEIGQAQDEAASKTAEVVFTMLLDRSERLSPMTRIVVRNLVEGVIASLEEVAGTVPTNGAAA